MKNKPTKIIENVTIFDSQQGNSTNEVILVELRAQIQSAEKVGELNYIDPQFE